MFAAALRIDLRIRGARSLKEKRHVVKSLTSQLARKFGVAVSEVDHQDLWNRATIGIAAVTPQASQLDRILHTIERYVRDRSDVELLHVAVSHLEDPQ
jgi:uncharacterized protein YlxP (DUF503 family)